MSEGTRVIVRTLVGPPGEVTRDDFLDLEERLEGSMATSARSAMHRGDLPPTVDLNAFGGHEHTGSWRIRSDGDHTNGPPLISTGLLEVLRQPGTFGTLAVLQRVTDSAASWWREALDYGLRQWGPWRRVATGEDVSEGEARFAAALEATHEEISRVDRALTPSTIAYSEAADGRTTFVHGDPNHMIENGIASVTKLMTVWTARQHLTDAELDSLAEVAPSDMSDSPHLQPGDVLTYRDLFHAALVSSDSTAPNVLARTIGQKIAPGSASPRSVFLAEMTAEAERLGYHGAAFPMAISAAVLSARHVVDLFRRVRADDELHPIPATLSHVLQIVAGPNPRSITIGHTIDPDGPVPLPEFVAGKTGTAGGRQHVVVAWQHPDGTEHVTAILNGRDEIPSHRYHELRRVITATRSVTAEVLGAAAQPPNDTGIRDLSALVPNDQGWEPSRMPEIYVQRTGTTVFLTVEDMQRPAAGTGYRTLLTLPPGFRPAFAQYPRTWRGAMVYLRADGLLQVRDPGTSLDYVSLAFPAREDFPPAPYPGIAG